ncbi:sodium:proton antiporter [Parvularcula sp. LCG005]|uniref:cation:proton antiporter n=1 Tax=Parvularcula sp. LCG005 TaxID=3078805 RepID=UPI0029437197|nr:sodium:proton antiporter [Parvularcula sp. LCG005]WOI54185.1 sodium:proton antiporter [Parvularcula sp. LCG005]
MTETLLLAIALIGVLGVGAQWMAWRFNLPGIVLMSIAGLLAGPVFHILQPEATFGEFYRTIISVAVAVILFEGGLQLKFRELKGLGRGVVQLCFVGGPIAWVLGAMAAHHIAGLSWPTAIVFGGIMIVTGPTVIMPLLRQAKLTSRPSALLKWEGIINDPVGALAAVIVYEYLHTRNISNLTDFQVFGSLIIGTILCVLWGVLVGWLMAVVFRRGWVPEYLKSPVLLTTVLGTFALANVIQEEGGLLAVTAMGVTMANVKMPSINQLRHFKENIAILFVAGVFVILTANLSWETLGQLDGRAILFVAVMLFVVRPVSVIFSTIGTDLKWPERLMLAWIAPRGIVAVAVSGLFAGLMAADGVEDGMLMVPLAFAMVFATVILHGFTIAPLGRMLGLASTLPPGVLIVGASPWSIELAKRIREFDIPVLVADPSFRRLRSARQAGLDTFYGEILSEVSEHHIEFSRFGYLLALGGNEAHNALVCTDLAPEMDRAKTYQLTAQRRDESRTTVSYSLRGRSFLSVEISLDELLRRHWAGWAFQFTKLSEEFTVEKYNEGLPDDAMLVMALRKGVLVFDTEESPLEPQNGDRVLAYVPPAERKPVQPETEVEMSRSKEAEELEARKQAAIDKVSP